MSRIVIIGGGISGLALAWQLEQLAPTADVTVLERAARPGGVIGTVQRDGFRVETGPNGFLDNHPAMLALCQELGLKNRLIPASEAARKNRFVFLRQQLHRLPTGLWSFLTSDVFSWRAKFALFVERFRRHRRDPADESVEDFARRRTCAEVAGTLVDAFVTGIHAGDPGLLSVRAAFPRLALFEREHGSILRGMSAAAHQRRQEARARGEQPQPMRMWSFPDGLGLVVERLSQRLRKAPVTAVSVQRIVRSTSASEWVLSGEGQDRWHADAVVLCCPAYQQAAILADIDPVLAEDIGGIAYNRIAVVALGYRRADVPHPLDGFGYLSPGRDRRDVLGMQWCSSIFSGRAPEDCVLLRALCGGWHRAEMAGWEDEQLVSAVRNEMRLVLGVTTAPIFRQIIRWDRAIPQYHLGHLERVARIEQRLKEHRRLYLGGNCYHGVSLNDCVEQAGVLARSIVASTRGAGNP